MRLIPVIASVLIAGLVSWSHVRSHPRLPHDTIRWESRGEDPFYLTERPSAGVISIGSHVYTAW